MIRKTADVCPGDRYGPVDSGSIPSLFAALPYVSKKEYVAPYV
jgi:hypothetical protein